MKHRLWQQHVSIAIVVALMTGVALRPNGHSSEGLIALVVLAHAIIRAAFGLGLPPDRCFGVMSAKTS
ncbi:hypothetical protein [Sphingomonas arenae]|uniref:hypothetical protein n=1 Tax=Sphingomonas arenae TaxID=2812555 RepID=UPI001967E437|nr:hypothetical protein [Sphingomonas arenae]